MFSRNATQRKRKEFIVRAEIMHAFSSFQAKTDIARMMAEIDFFNADSDTTGLKQKIRKKVNGQSQMKKKTTREEGKKNKSTRDVPVDATPANVSLPWFSARSSTASSRSGDQKYPVAVACAGSTSSRERRRDRLARKHANKSGIL